ncbi:MAG: hypothetical protein KDC67_15645 [Ignavibacteriae bacterium]|nr:hypothetical protein [Ignavibacteriota bacterium]
MIKWLLAGDPSIQYQVNRDLLNRENESLQNIISQKGWGAKYLSLQNQNGHWGFGFYQPKWISTHYTLLDLKNLCISPKTKKIQNIIEKVLNNEMLRENDSKHNIVSEDICINGMVLNYASYFKSNENNLKSIVDYLLDNQMNDGGFNCHSTRIGAVHSSLHTTLSVLEGLFEFRINNYTYKIQKIKKVESEVIEFILQHKLYKSDKTGSIIKPSFTRMPYPPRWKYDVLRCLDFFQYAKVPYDSRMNDALELILSKRGSNGVWKLQAKHPGKVHFEMEKPGQPSRWNTLRALRVLKYFK